MRGERLSKAGAGPGDHVPAVEPWRGAAGVGAGGRLSRAHLSRLHASVKRAGTSRMAGDAFVYLASTLINMGLPFLLLPVFTRLMTPAEYGPVVIVQGALGFLAAILVLGLRAIVLREFVAEGGAIARGSFGGAVLLTFICTGALVAIAAAMWVLGVRAINLPPQWLIYIALSAGLGVPLQYYLAVLQARRRVKAFAVAQNLTTVVSAALSLSFLFMLSGTWQNRAAGMLLGPALAGMAALAIAARGEMVGRPTRGIMRDHLAFALATLPHAAVNAFLGFADRLFVAHYAARETLAFYGVASQLCLVPFAIGMALNTALAPWWVEQLKRMRTVDDWRRLRTIGLSVSAGVCVMCFVYLGFVYVIIDLILPASYRGAWQFVPILFVGALFNVIYFQFVPPIFYYKRTRILSRIGYANLAFTLAAMFVLASLLGAIGVALALAGSRLFLLVWTVVAADRLVREQVAAA